MEEEGEEGEGEPLKIESRLQVEAIQPGVMEGGQAIVFNVRWGTSLIVNDLNL